MDGCTRGASAGGVLVALVLGLLPGGAASKTVYTSCVDLCPNMTATLCQVDAVRTVVAGSRVNCGTRTFEVLSGGVVKVNDGRFELHAGAVTVKNGGRIEAESPQGHRNIGFVIRAAGDFEMPYGGGPKLRARSDEEGGVIEVHATGDILIQGDGIDASGTAADAPGGAVVLSAGGDVTIDEKIHAQATGGTAQGGSVSIRATNITVANEIMVKGYGGGDFDGGGGEVELVAEENVTITSGLGLNAETAQGDGGDIMISAGNTVTVGKPLKVSGIGSGGQGGTIHIESQTIVIDNDLMAKGGRDGGGVLLEARGGTVAIGAGTAASEVNVSGNNGGVGGTLEIVSHGNDVTIGGSAILRATDQSSGGEGGTISLVGVDVAALSGAKLYADGPSGSGGLIDVQARGDLTLVPTVLQAVNGRLYFGHRDGTPTIGSGVAAGYTLTQYPGLTAPCGDEVRRVGVEDCDGADLGEATCISESYSGGELGCTASCTFDTSNCN